MQAQQYYMMANPHHSKPTEHNFRQTGKFKPILDCHLYFPNQALKKPFKVQLLSPLIPSAAIPTHTHSQGQSKWWRLYFQEPLAYFDQSSLPGIVERCFEVLLRDHQLDQNKNAQIFINVNGVLIERVRGELSHYHLSNLDFNCLVVALKSDQNKNGSQPKHRLECHQMVPGRKIREDTDFGEQIYIRMKEELTLFHLIKKNRGFFLVRDRHKQSPSLQLTQQHFQQTNADIPKSTLMVRNLSPRIISLKFLEQTYTKNTEPLEITISNQQIYQSLLFKINRIKYQKYRVEESDGNKQWHSFDDKLKKSNTKESKTTPEKLKNVGRGGVQHTALNRISNKSTNFIEEQPEPPSNKKINKIMVQTKQMKISQRVVTNPKESIFLASDVDYPVSVKDGSQRQCPYYDDFQNLLFDDGGEEKQLSLNDSFEQFQKKDDSKKNMKIMEDLKRRKSKELQQERNMNSLQEKVVSLMNEEKEWIDKNFKLNIDVKRMQKNQASSEQNRQIEDIKTKVYELQQYQKALMDQLSNVRFENNIQVLVFGQKEGPQSSESQRNIEDNNKIFHSINGLHAAGRYVQDPLISSIRSNNKGQYNFKMSVKDPVPYKGAVNTKSTYIKRSCIPTKGNHNLQPSMYSDKAGLLSLNNIYASVPTSKSFIESPSKAEKNPNTVSDIHSNSSNSNSSFFNFTPRNLGRNVPESFELSPSALTFSMSPQISHQKIITSLSSPPKP